ncbi:hypothetical protein BH10PSE14_BH10PSE14_04560 [soil metagenome]
MKQYMVDLAGLDRFPGLSAVAEADLGKLAEIELCQLDGQSTYVVKVVGGKAVGFLPRRGDLAKALLAGAKLGHLSWQSIGFAQDGTSRKLRIRAVIVEGDETFEMPPMKSASAYPLGIVGESNYQLAISRCAVGDVCVIVHEIGNPYDSLALAVLSAHGDKIGFIAKSSWLRTAIHEEGKWCDATIRQIAPSEAGLLAVVLDVTLCDGPISTLAYEP